MGKKLNMITGLLVLLSLVTSSLVITQQNENHEADKIFRDVAESIVIVQDEDGWGTGFLVNARSGRQVILTNAHVCDSDKEKPMFFLSHRKGNKTRVTIKQPTSVIKKDPTHDLCMLYVPAGLDEESIPLADEVILDSRVHIIGYPIEPLLSASEGRIRGMSAVDMQYPLPIEKCEGVKYHIKTVPIKRDDGKIGFKPVCFMRAMFLFTDAISDHGASGSPVLNSNGEIVGVMSIVSGSARPFASIVPLDYVQRFLATY